MRSRTRITLTVALALLAGLMVPSCEDSQLLAPADGQIIVTANPARATVDPVNGPATADITITAQVFDMDSFPLQKVSVTFSTTGGELASEGPGNVPGSVETDKNGVAVDVLTVSAADGPAAVVTARSGTVLETVSVDVDVAGQNDLPTAVLEIVPANRQGVGQPVVFSGAASTDPDGDLITCYQWTITPPTGSQQIIQLTGPTTPQQTFGQFTPPSTATGTGTLSVTLRVSDDPEINCTPTPALPATMFSGDIDTIASYSIVCDASAPTAEAGAPQTVTLSSGGEVTLNGGVSSDAQTGIVEYRWTCGNGMAETVGPSPTVDCTYTTTGTKTAQLTVENGCGDMASDTVSVTVNP